MFLRTRLLFLLACGLLAGCTLALPPVTMGRSTPLDAPFTLTPNQAIAVAGEPATLRLEPWVEDNRCPAGAECAESGPVRVQITLWREGRPTAYPVFAVHTDQAGAVLAGAPGSEHVAKVGPYLITITAVTPYPTDAEPIETGAYAATFVVSKDAAALPDTDADMKVITDVPFTLAPGEQVTLVGRDVALRVDSVADQRCPDSAGCKSEGGAEVRLSWLDAGAPPRSIRLAGATDETGAVLPTDGALRSFELIDGAGIRLLRVAPAPTTGGEIAQGDYRVTLMLEPGPRMPNGSEFAEPGAAFSLTPDHTAVIGQDVLRVRFDAVASDSRCPLLVDCVQSGDVQVAVTVASTGQRATTYVLGGATNNEGVLLDTAEIVHDGFAVRLRQVAPYPEHPDAPIAADAYVATFVVDALVPLPTLLPTITAPAVTPDASQLPLLCINDFALVRLAAGIAAANERTVQFTMPLAQDAATDYGRAHALCNKPFGPEWVQAGPGDVERFAEFLPAGQPFWVWDGMAGGLVRTAP
jgi:hypothetical protein